MRISNLVVLLVSGLLALAASAQGLVIPDRQLLQSMSREEYDVYREQMRSRTEELSTAERNLMREPGVDDRKQTVKPGGGYGQGYGSRPGQGEEQGGMGGHGGYGRSGGGGRRR